MSEQSDLSFAEVAAILGVHEQTVRNMAARGQLAAYRAGRLWRVTREALDAFRAGRREAVPT